MLYTEVFYFATILISQVSSNTVDNPLNYLNQLKAKIDNYLQIGNTHYDEISTNLRNKIQEISSNSIIPQILSSLNNELSISSPCFDSTNNKITLLTDHSRSGITDCAAEALSKTDNLVNQAAILLQKTTTVSIEVVARIENCVKRNFMNDVGLALCLLAQVAPVESLLQNLGNEFETTIGVEQQVAQDIIFTLNECLSQLERSTRDASNVIMKSYEDCTFNN